MQLICRQLTHKEILQVYRTYSKLHFPANERKPLSSIRLLLARGQYSGYGCFIEDKLVEGRPNQPGGKGRLTGYALMLHDSDKKSMLLDYYAFLEEYRCQGLGGLFLKELCRQPEIPGFYLECEAPESAEAPAERQLRERRINFYLRNGAVLTQVQAWLFGVDYRILLMGMKEVALPDSLKQFYLSIYPVSVYEKFIHLRLS